MRKGRAEIISLQDNVSGLAFDLYKKRTFLQIVLSFFLPLTFLLSWLFSVLLLQLLVY